MKHRTSSQALLILYIAVSLAISLAAAYSLGRVHPLPSLFDLSFLVGPGAESLLERHTLTIHGVVGTPGDVLLLRSSRMPVAALFVAFGARLFGAAGVVPTILLKAAISWALVLAAAALALRWLLGKPVNLVVYLLLLFVPFCLPSFLADVANIQVEEGYSFCLLALATALVMFLPQAPRDRPRLAWVLLLACVLDVLYLSKSSMLGAVFVLTCGAMYRFRAPSSRVLLLLLVLLAPLAWGSYQKHVGGRWTTGTSLDQMNFHKGNNEEFLQNYPPKIGHSLDDDDGELNQYRSFPSEWAFSDWHRDAAHQFIRTHPKATVVATWRKFEVFFLSLEDYGSANHLPRVVTLSGLLLFRLGLWAAIGAAVYTLVASRGRTWFESSLFLMLVAVCALPYLAGFAYIRHASVLIFPCSLALCRLLPGIRSLEGNRRGYQSA